MSEIDRSAALNLPQLRKLAKELLRAARAGDALALARIQAVHPQTRIYKLAHAQLVIARDAGFDSWPKLVKELETDELQRFRRALQTGDAPAVKALLNSSAYLRRQVDAPIGDFGAKPITMAAAHRAVLDVLLDFGGDVNARSVWGKGPFGVLDFCDEATARHLLTRGAILTPHAAARLGWLDELRQLVASDPDCVHARGGDGQQPLHFSKTPEIVDFLLDHGAGIDTRCLDHHSTPAQYALADRPDVCRRLLERGATPDIFMAARLGDVALAKRLIESDPACLTARTRHDGCPPVHRDCIYNWTLGFFLSPHDVALKFGHADVYELLLHHSPAKVRFYDAISHNDLAAARELMKSLTLESGDHRALAMAVFHEQFAAAKIMLELGFDPRAGGIDGGTALHAAALVGNVELLEAILKTKRVDVNAQDPTHNSTPLGWALWGATNRCAPGADYRAVVQRLIRGGAQPNPEQREHPLVRAP